MSKEGALRALTGIASGNPVTNGSLITGQIPTPGLSEADVSTETAETPKVERPGLDSDRFAAFAKKEAKLQRERDEWKAQIQRERAEVDELKKKLQDPYDKIQAFEALRAQDPIAALKKIGFSETDIFNFMAGAEKKEPTTAELAAQAAQEEIKKFREEQQAAASELQKQGDEKLVKDHKASIAKTIADNKETYEFVAFHGAAAQELVENYITEVLTAENVLISPKEAIEAIEKYYEDDYNEMKALKKLQPKADIAPEVKVEPARTRTVEPPKAAPQPKTLTNKVSATAAAAIPRKETSEQKRQRLMDRLRNGA